MSKKNPLAGYAYMRLPGYKEVDPATLQRHSESVTHTIKQDLKDMQFKKEQGARKAGELVLD